MGDRVSDVGEKVKVGGIRVGRTVLESKGFGFGYDRKRSNRSEVNNELTWLRNDKLIFFARLIRPKWFDYK